MFKLRMRVQLELPGHDIPCICTGEECLYPEGNLLNELHKFKNQFIFKTISYQSFLRRNCRVGKFLNQGIEQMVNLCNYLQTNYKP